MKRRLMTLALAAIMLMSILTGCGGKDESSASGESATTGASSTTARELRLSLPVPEGTDTYNQAVAAKEYFMFIPAFLCCPKRIISYTFSSEEMSNQVP